MMLRARRFLLPLVVVLAACGGATPTPPPKSSAVAAAAVAGKQNTPAFGADHIDSALREAWQREGLTPAPRVDDATFVRRAYLDVVGTIPTPEATTAFVANAEPDKRRKLVDSLLAATQYAEHWMNYWDD